MCSRSGAALEKIPDYEICEFPTPLQSTKKFNKKYRVVNIMKSSNKIFDFFKASKYLLRRQQQQQQQQFIHTL